MSVKAAANSIILSTYFDRILDAATFDLAPDGPILVTIDLWYDATDAVSGGSKLEQPIDSRVIYV